MSQTDTPPRELIAFRIGDQEFCVDIRAVRDMPKPVSLKDVKANPKLTNMSLVTSMRLSVQPVTEEEWIEVCRMGDLDNPPR